MAKRLFDFVASLAGLCVLSPVFIVIAIIVKMDSPGPVFFVGERIGRHGRPFWMLKFRSMLVNTKGEWVLSRINDAIITASGRFLRKTRLDELPQLVNVLKGDMSLVGPRPEVAFYVDQYSPGEKHALLAVRPGLTDPAALFTFDQSDLYVHCNDPVACYQRVIQPVKLKLQMEYLRTRSFWGDIGILFKTVFKVVRPGWLPGDLRECHAEAARAVENM